jgi:hypothetical protein
MPMMVAVLLATSMLGQARNAKPVEVPPLLVSSDRMERNKAAGDLTAMPSIPESALPDIIQYLKLEVAQAMVPDTRPAHQDVQDLDRIPVVGDELSLARLKASADQYIETRFKLAGAITIDDYYNYGFRDAQATHYSFRLTVAAKNGQPDEPVPIYMSRFKGAALAERITRTQERQANTAMAVRLECIVRRKRIEGDTSHVASSIEATDWQVLTNDGKTWMPWTFDAILLGYDLIGKTGKASIAACMDLIMQEQQFQSEKADTMLKAMAISYLLNLPAKDRTLALRRVSLRAKKVKSPTAKTWTRRLYASLEAGDLVL